jgi:hypothetical protein
MKRQQKGVEVHKSFGRRVVKTGIIGLLGVGITFAAHPRLPPEREGVDAQKQVDVIVTKVLVRGVSRSLEMVRGEAYRPIAPTGMVAASASAQSTSVQYHDTSGQMTLVHDANVVWGSSVVWGSNVPACLNVVWGAWGSRTMAGFNVVWGCKLCLGQRFAVRRTPQGRNLRQYNRP